MHNHKTINLAISKLLDEPHTYDIRKEFRVIESELDLESAEVIFNSIPESQRHLYAITSSPVSNYCGDLELAAYAAKRIAEKTGYTFVLTLDSGTWVAAFGDFGDCAEYKGSNPAYVTCVAVLKFMGKL